jgi:hypothetical protein
MTYSVRPANLRDAYDLAPRLRADDVREAMAAGGMSALDALTHGVRAGESWVGCVDDRPVGIYGLVGTPDPLVGVPWMLASEDLVSHQKWFLRNCRAGVEEMQRRYPVLFNFVDARNAVHVRWLRWCGFTFIHLHKEFGHERRPFYEFVRI